MKIFEIGPSSKTGSDFDEIKYVQYIYFQNRIFVLITKNLKFLQSDLVQKPEVKFFVKNMFFTNIIYWFSFIPHSP